MRVYRKKYNVSEAFPVEIGQTWVVTERDLPAERWEVLEVRRGFFVAEITEFFPKGQARHFRKDEQ